MMKRIFILLCIALNVHAQQIRTTPTSSFTTPFSVDLSGGINSLSPKKYSIRPWTFDNTYPAVYFSQNIPDDNNYFALGDSTFNVVNGARSLHLRSGGRTGITITATETYGNTGEDLINGFVNIGASATTATATNATGRYIPQLRFTPFSYSLTSASTTNNYLIFVGTPTINSTGNNTTGEWATMNFPTPVFGASVTATRVFGISTPTDVSIGGRGIFGASGTAPTKTLDVRGNAIISSSLTTNGIANTGTISTSSTFSLGAANLTGGNTGTVAVRSDVILSYQFGWSQQNPADATNYYLSSANLFNANIAGNARIVLPVNCTFIGYSFNNVNLTTNATNEASTLNIRKNNTTNTALNSAITFSATSLVSDFTKSISFTAGDDFAAFITTATFATNPLSSCMEVVFYFKQD